MAPTLKSPPSRHTFPHQLLANANTNADANANAYADPTDELATHARNEKPGAEEAVSRSASDLAKGTASNQTTEIAAPVASTAPSMIQMTEQKQPLQEGRRKRDVVRQISMRLYVKGRDIAGDVLRNVVPRRVEDTEQVCATAHSSLEHEIAPSRKTRKHLWQPTTQDDSVLIHGTPMTSLTHKQHPASATLSSTTAPALPSTSTTTTDTATGSVMPSAREGRTTSEIGDTAAGPTLLKKKHRTANHHAVDAFIISRVTDPTSYFYRFHVDDHRHLTPQRAEVQLVDITWLKPHEQVVSWDRVHGLKKATIAWDAYTEPLLVDIRSGAILDGHHRYNVGLQLRLKQVPAVLVDYLGDHSITVDVWPGCGRATLTKEEVVEMSLSSEVFPPKTSRHRFTESLPPISIPLSVLRQLPTSINQLTLSVPMPVNSKHKVEGEDAMENDPTEPVDDGSRPSRLRNVSISLICGAQDLASSVTKSLFRSRLRKHESETGETQLDLMKRPALKTASDFFTIVRENDPTSSFCRQKAATFEDLLSTDASRREKFFLTRICDPTSYFYKYHFDAPPQRQPKKAAVHIVALHWLKPHEHVVSWDRVDGLRRATKSWDAYLEPLLVDSVTGAILDGHHRYHVGLQLGLEAVPCVLVDYLGDEGITVDVWPDCGRDNLTKQEVIAMSLSDDVFPPKTSRHKFSDDLPPISIPLARLREKMTVNYCEV